MICRSGDNLQEIFSYLVGPGTQTRVVRLGGNLLYLLSISPAHSHILLSLSSLAFSRYLYVFI